MAPVIHSPPSELIQATPSLNPPFPTEPQPALEGKQVVDTPRGPRHATLRPHCVLAEPLANMQLPLPSVSFAEKWGRGLGAKFSLACDPQRRTGTLENPHAPSPPPPDHFTDEETETQRRRLAIIVIQQITEGKFIREEPGAEARG